MAGTKWIFFSDTIGVDRTRQWEFVGEDKMKEGSLSKFKSYSSQGYKLLRTSGRFVDFFSTCTVQFKGPITSSQNVPNTDSENRLMSKLPEVAHEG